MRAAIVRSPAEVDRERRHRLVGELRDEILSSYREGNLPYLATPTIRPEIGTARIGVRPADFLVGERLAPRRWPWRLDDHTPAAVESRRLEIHLSRDEPVTAAWLTDDIAWRIDVCGHTAIIPLRLSALYAHDGDRWIEVVEHLSYARIPVPDGGLAGTSIETVVVARSLADELSESLDPLLAHLTDRMSAVLALDPGGAAVHDPTQPAPTLLIAPDPGNLWRGDQDVARLRLVDGEIHAENRRIGTVGRSVGAATIAYWVGNFVADLPARQHAPAGEVRLRGTFTFENRAGRWLVVQGHLSAPISGPALAQAVFGTELAVSEQDLRAGKPLAFVCNRRGHPAPRSAAPGAGP